MVAVQDFRPGRSRHFKSALTFGSSFNRSALNSQRLGVFLSREMKAERVVVRDEFPLFDWLRFALASAVALTHEGVIPWDTAANLAVQIFFALSGWLIGGILLRTDVQHLPRFYFNRATRIWIPYLFAVAALYLLAALREPVTASTFRYLAYDLTFTHNWFVTAALMPSMPLQGTGAHFWSIAVEEQFYLAAPLLILLTPFGRSVLAWAAIAAFVALAHSWFGSISFGVLAAVARRRFGDWQQTRAGAIIVAAGTAATAATVLALPSYYNLLCPLLAIGVVLLTSWPGKRSEIGSFLGGVSYPLYLWHWTGAFVIHALRIPSPWIAYLFAVAVGIAAYMLVDRNIMRLRGKLYRPAAGKALMIAAYGLLAAGVAFGLAQ